MTTHAQVINLDDHRHRKRNELAAHYIAAARQAITDSRARDHHHDPANPVPVLAPVNGVGSRRPMSEPA